MSTGEQEGDYWARLWRRGFRGQSTGALAEQRVLLLNFSSREKKKEENIWRRKIFFAKEKTNREGRGGKYFDKESIVLLEENISRRIFFGGE